MNLRDVGEFILKVGRDWFPIKKELKDNRDITRRNLKKFWSRSVIGDLPYDNHAEQLNKIVKARKRHTLTNLRNIMSAVRGTARGIQAIGKNGRWVNIGVLDSNQTVVCSKYMGKHWYLHYRDIPDKPPRISKIYHPCRSYLEFILDGQPAPNQDNFMTRFKDDSFKREILGETRYNALKSGDLKINTFKQYEDAVLHTLKEQGLQ